VVPSRFPVAVRAAAAQEDRCIVALTQGTRELPLILRLHRV
jgi:hypothetical protein